MKIIVKDRDAKLTRREESLILDKFKDVSKILKGFKIEEKIANLRVKKGSRWGYRVSFSMRLPKKKHIFAEVKGNNFKNAVNKLKDLVERQITDYKEKTSESRGKNN
jgi:ribosome-associated translation inhibitor RaiA